MLRRAFRLSVRRITGYLENGQPLDLTPAQDAAEAVADREEEFIYRGLPDFPRPEPKLRARARCVRIAQCRSTGLALIDIG